MINALWETVVFLATVGGLMFGFVFILALVGIATKDHKGRGYDNEM